MRMNSQLSPQAPHPGHARRLPRAIRKSLGFSAVCLGCGTANDAQNLACPPAPINTSGWLVASATLAPVHYSLPLGSRVSSVTADIQTFTTPNGRGWVDIGRDPKRAPLHADDWEIPTDILPKGKYRRCQGMIQGRRAIAESYEDLASTRKRFVVTFAMNIDSSNWHRVGFETSSSTTADSMLSALWQSRRASSLRPTHYRSSRCPKSAFNLTTWREFRVAGGYATMRAPPKSSITSAQGIVSGDLSVTASYVPSSAWNVSLFDSLSVSTCWDSVGSGLLQVALTTGFPGIQASRGGKAYAQLNDSAYIEFNISGASNALTEADTLLAILRSLSPSVR